MEIQNIKNKLANFDIDYENFVEHSLSGKYKIPNQQKILNENLTEEESFYLLANIVFETCDGFVNQIPSITNLGDYAAWKELVGEFRASNFKKAVYEEVKYRSLSNNLPELANWSFISPNNININDRSRDLNVFADLLNLVSQNYLLQCDWQLLEINGENAICMPDIRTLIEKKVQDLNAKINKKLDVIEAEKNYAKKSEIPDVTHSEKLAKEAKELAEKNQDEIKHKQSQIKNSNEHVISSLGILHTSQWDQKQNTKFNDINSKIHNLEIGALKPYLPFSETNSTPWFKSYYGDKGFEFKGNLNALFDFLAKNYQDKPNAIINFVVNYEGIMFDGFGNYIEAQQPNVLNFLELSLYSRTGLNSNFSVNNQELKLRNIHIKILFNSKDNFEINGKIEGEANDKESSVTYVRKIKADIFSVENSYCIMSWKSDDFQRCYFDSFINYDSFKNYFQNSVFLVRGHFGVGLGQYLAPKKKRKKRNKKRKNKK